MRRGRRGRREKVLVTARPPNTVGNYNFVALDADASPIISESPAARVTCRHDDFRRLSSLVLSHTTHPILRGVAPKPPKGLLFCVVRYCTIRITSYPNIFIYPA